MLSTPMIFPLSGAVKNRLGPKRELKGNTFEMHGTKMGAAAEKVHLLLVPLAAQGHINPMMELGKKLVSDGFLVTFVNTEHNQYRVMEAKNKMKLPQQEEQKEENNLRMVTIPDGLPPEANRADLSKLFLSLAATLVSSLHKLIQDINRKEAHKVTCLILDMSLFYALDVAKHYNISSAVFSPTSVACSAICQSASSLISSGIVSSKGRPQVQEMIKVLPSMPPLHSTLLPWMFGSESEKEAQFESLVLVEKAVEADWLLFNSFDDLEDSVIDKYPKKGLLLCPVGPLIPSSFHDGKSEERVPTRPAALWAEEVECLDWLDRQATESVVYVAFGSLSVLNEKQFEELALGLEATGRPFLWVVRCDLMDGTTGVFPPGFVERVGDRGCLVSWAPQLGVLCHPSIACFVTHCGWNSIIESIGMGVPMLCWPFFADQFVNCSYVVNEWRIGFQLMPNEQGIIEKEKIVSGVTKLVDGEEGVDVKRRMEKVKKSAWAAVGGDGSSSTNYNRFVETLKSQGN